MPVLASFLCIVALSRCALAFSDTYPIVAWSSHSPSNLKHLPQSLSVASHATSVFETVFAGDDLCENDAIVIIDQPGLHVSDLRALPHDSALVRTLTTAPSSRQFPYVRSPSRAPLSTIAQSLSQRCGALLVNVVPGDRFISLDSASKHVIHITFPHLDDSAGSRRNTLANHESRLFDELGSIASSFPHHLVVFAGSPLHSRRQSVDAPRPALRSVFGASGNSESSKNGILARYQLLTPELIISLLVTFFVIVPIVFIGISALASIQPPLRMEAPKGYNALEKKNQ